ncbi:hypothetical protein AB834_01515 [PVC group bacterium (ex Bugula neritina AB1)]|nr:hypothetical protein AB834_01515 [PVC group bacterium (ex Bugula neritina AB1)]
MNFILKFIISKKVHTRSRLRVFRPNKFFFKRAIKSFICYFAMFLSYNILSVLIKNKKIFECVVMLELIRRLKKSFKKMTTFALRFGTLPSKE